MADRLRHYGHNFAERHFEMTLTPGTALGGTEIFVPSDRHYPEGFRVALGAGLTLAHNRDTHQLQTQNAATAGDRAQAKRVHWHDNTQRLFIEQWVGENPRLTVSIQPAETSSAASQAK